MLNILDGRLRFQLPQVSCQNSQGMSASCIHWTALSSTLIPRNCQTMVTKSSSSANSFSTERTESLLTNTVSLIRARSLERRNISKKCYYFKYLFPTRMMYTIIILFLFKQNSWKYCFLGFLFMLLQPKNTSGFQKKVDRFGNPKMKSSTPFGDGKPRCIIRTS